MTGRRGIRGRRRGQVLVVVLLLGLPLSVLILAVATSGPAARQRMRLQTAADAAALAGATWSARALNLLVQAHETEAQLAAGLALLRAVRPARARAEAVLEDLLAAGIVSAEAVAAERQLLRDWEDGLADLLPLAEPGNPAGLWAAAETVESVLRAILQSVPSLAVRDAESIGRANGASEVAVWPAHPELPVAEAPLAVLQGRSDGWLRRGVPRLTAIFKAPTLSDVKTLYRVESEAALRAALGDASFPARPVAWRSDAREALDLTAFALGAEAGSSGALAFAQARPANPERGDLGTPGWVARLVPALRAGRAAESLSLEIRRTPPPPAWRLAQETIDALTCH
jgi:hypothetical protein